MQTRRRWGECGIDALMRSDQESDAEHFISLPLILDSISLWYPTMFLSIENKRELPPFPLTQVATITRTRHVDHGQFEMDVEIWSHPDDAAKFNLPPGVKSVMLCIGRQVALSIPISIQTAISKKNKAGAKL